MIVQAEWQIINIAMLTLDCHYESHGPTRRGTQAEGFLPTIEFWKRCKKLTNGRDRTVASFQPQLLVRNSHV